MSLNLSYMYNGRNIEFEVVYRKRKTMSIQVNIEGEVCVISPMNIKRETILEVVKKKAKWICKKQDELITKKSLKIVKKYVQGESYLYLGNTYTLDLCCNKEVKVPKVIINDNVIQIIYKDLTSDSVRSILELWYRQKTLDIVTKRVANYEKFFSVSPKGLKVKEQKRRWASCTYDNRILFNWRISMAPIDVIDYIVVHEMCHMDVKDHSINFWNRVKSILPDYELNHLWLKENGIKLEL